jgi:hypothetical protein
MKPIFKKGGKVYLLRKNIKIKRLSSKLDYKKLGLFEIKEIKGLINYKLKLPNNIRIYPVFYILLLELILAGAPKALYIEIDLINPNIIYNIEEILNC